MASEHTSCKSCGDSLISPLFCFSCNSLQTISDDIDHFEVMGLTHCFEIDSVELENRYQRLTLEMHPDFFGAAPEKQKRLSEKYSVTLNDGFLKDAGENSARKHTFTVNIGCDADSTSFEGGVGLGERQLPPHSSTNRSSLGRSVRRTNFLKKSPSSAAFLYIYALLTTVIIGVFLRREYCQMRDSSTTKTSPETCFW